MITDTYTSPEGITSTVYNADCLAYMKTLPDKYFSLAVVDPEYGININESIGRYKGQKHSGHKKAYWDSKPPPPEYFEQLFRVSENQVIWGANYFGLPPCKCFLIWDKKISEQLTFSMCEYAWTSFKTMAKVFYYNPANDRPKPHPTAKPVALYDWILKNYAKPNDTIFDSHLGSQSSRIAAHKAGLAFVGLETDSEYFEKGNKRFQNHVAQLTIF